MEVNNEINLFELQVDHEATDYLREAAKWARFLAILGFIFSGIFVLFGIVILMTRSGVYGSSMTAFISVFYVILGVAYLFPCIYGNSFAGKMRTALQNNDQEHLNSSFRSLRATLRYLGIMAIVGLSLMIIGIFFNLFSDLSRF